MSEECLNPICKAPLGPRKRRTKKFCSDRCRLDGWALAHAARLLFQIEPARWYEILKMSEGNGKRLDKAKGEKICDSPVTAANRGSSQASRYRE
jgi:hypothetical protein